MRFKFLNIDNKNYYYIYLNMNEKESNDLNKFIELNLCDFNYKYFTYLNKKQYSIVECNSVDEYIEILNKLYKEKTHFLDFVVVDNDDITRCLIEKKFKIYFLFIKEEDINKDDIVEIVDDILKEIGVKDRNRVLVRSKRIDISTSYLLRRIGHLYF